MTIPESAKKVFEGVIFDIYQWQQEMFDGTYRTFEAAKRNDSVQVIAVHDGRLIVLDEEQPHRGKFRGLVGGEVEAGESPLEAAQREMREETGLVSGDWEQYWVATVEGHLAWSVHYFIARNCRQAGSANPEIHGERIRVLRLTFDEFVAEATKEAFRSQLLSTRLLRMLHAGKLADFRKQVMG